MSLQFRRLDQSYMATYAIKAKKSCSHTQKNLWDYNTGSGGAETTEQISMSGIHKLSRYKGNYEMNSHVVSERSTLYFIYRISSDVVSHNKGDSD